MTKESLWGALTQGFDIVATAEQPGTKDQLRLMLQSLLSDRFDLKLHRESKVAPVYRLVITKTGLQAQKSADGEEFGMLVSEEAFAFHHAEMFRLAGLLSGQLDRPVVDGTGLTDPYNFTLKKPQEAPQSANIKSETLSPDSPSATLFGETLKALGLELTKATTAVDYLVVDSLRKPSAE